MGSRRGKNWRLSEAYRFEGFYPQDEKLRGIFGKPQARILPLKRRSKKLDVESAAGSTRAGTTVRPNWSGIYHAAIHNCTLRYSTGEWTVRIVAQ